MSDYEQIQQSAQYIRTIADFQPEVGIILGTGLGNFVGEVAQKIEIPYQNIPHFPVSTVESHAGKLILGKLSGRRVVILSGRFHWYEGYSMRQVTFPVRVLKALGISKMVLTNASGSLNKAILAGDLVFMRDHINMLPDNPLRGQNDVRLGVRFPDMSNVYDKSLIAKGLEICKKHHIRATSGVYVALPGPNLETPAEHIFLNRMGADVVGMSTVPEAIVAKHAELTLLAISIATNECFPLEGLQETSLEDVIAVAKQAAEKLGFVLSKLLETHVL